MWSENCQSQFGTWTCCIFQQKQPLCTMCQVPTLTDPGGCFPGSPGRRTTRQPRTPKPVCRIFQMFRPQGWKVGPKWALGLPDPGGLWAQEPLLGGYRETYFSGDHAERLATPSRLRGGWEPLRGDIPLGGSPLLLMQGSGMPRWAWTRVFW